MYQVYTWQPLVTGEMQEQLNKMWKEGLELVAVWDNFFIFKERDNGAVGVSARAAGLGASAWQVEPQAAQELPFVTMPVHQLPQETKRRSW